MSIEEFQKEIITQMTAEASKQIAQYNKFASPLAQFGTKESE